MSIDYPFSAVVGQDDVKTALLLCAVNPAIGGVLIRGDKGTAKSTLARGLSQLLPQIEHTPGCAFNCAPGEACPSCDVCQREDAVPEPVSVPFVSLPLGATEDRVLGSLDFDRALREGKKVFQPGLLAAAHRGILYIDEVNLLPDHLVDVLLDVAAMGVNCVQREGLSVTHPARIMLIGTMNPEEGDLRPQLLDRFGLMVDVHAPTDPATRAEVVRRRIAFESDPQRFAARWAEEQGALRRRIQEAQRRLPTVGLDDGLISFIASLCCELEVHSLRADIVMHKVACALAAMAGRDAVTLEDIRRAAELALPHRRRHQPFEQPGLDKERLDQLMSKAHPSAMPALSQENAGGTPSPPLQATVGGNTLEEETFPAGPAGAVGRIEIASVAPKERSGRRSLGFNARRGRYVRAVPCQNPSDIAVSATLRHAALREPGALRVSRADLHQKVKIGKSGSFILFVVDASGSMAARRRMEAVKGAVVSLLGDAYRRRDEIGVIAFRGTDAELLVPPTCSVELAEQRMRQLPTGGRTPLPHALRLASYTVGQVVQKGGAEPLLVVLSDGKANVSLDGGDAWQETLGAASELRRRTVKALVLDTECGYMRLGKARELARALGATYLPLEELSAEGLTLMIRSQLNGSPS